MPSTSATTSETIRLTRFAEADADLLHDLEGFLRKSERAGYAREEEQATNGRAEAVRLIGRLERCRWTVSMKKKKEVLS